MYTSASRYFSFPRLAKIKNVLTDIFLIQKAMVFVLNMIGCMMLVPFLMS